MIKILTIILCINSAATLNSSVLYKTVFNYHNETYDKAEFAYQVVEKIYKAFRQWYFTVIFCEFTYFENRILKYTETKDDGYPVLLLNSCPDPDKTVVKPKLTKHGQTAYVVSSEVLSLEVNEIVVKALIKTGIFKPRSPVIFVINVPVVVDSYFYYAMKQHFMLLFSRRITNSVLVVWSDKLKIYTYNPFLNVVLDVTEVKNISHFLSRIYYNLHGHVLRLSVFRKIFLTNDSGPLHCDSRLAKTVMKFLNATCVPLVPRDGSTVGDLLENGTATGVTGDLIDGYTDLELNSRILKTSYYGYIDTTDPLTQDELCFLIKKSGRQSAFMTTIKLISTDMLLLLTFNVIFFITVALLIRKAEARLWNIKETQSTSSNMMDIIKCFLRQTVDIAFEGLTFRIIILMIIIYSLIIDCAIDGIITSAVTYPRFKPNIDTLSDLVKQKNITFGVHNRHMAIFNKSLSEEYYKKIKDRIEVFSDKKIKNVIEKRMYEYALLLRKSDALYLSRKPSNMKDGRELYHIVKECPIPCSIVYGLKYGSPYLPRINYLLHHLNQAGIMQHWTESDDFSLYKNFGKILSSTDNKDRKPLSFENFQEVFIVWMVGLFISGLVFCLEILFNKFQKALLIL